MRILFVNSIRMFAGGEVWMLTAMKELQRRHHYVQLLCRTGTELARRAGQLGLPLTTIRMSGDFDPRSIWQTWQIIKRNHIDTILTNMDKELRFAGLAARLTGVKGIFPRRGIDYPLKNRWRYRFAYNLLATRLIANSFATRDALLKNAPWLKSERIVVIHNGIDPEPYLRPARSDLKSEFHISPDAPVIGFIGQLDERKGIHILLQSFERVQQQIPMAVLLMVGTGVLMDRIRGWANDHRLTDRIMLVGFRDDIPDIMNTIDMLVLPSFWEGFGIVLIEAMAAAKPVISTRVSSMPEIVDHPQTGLLVEAGNVEQLTDAIIRLTRDSTMARQMGALGRKRVQDYFNLNRMIVELETVLKIRE